MLMDTAERPEAPSHRTAGGEAAPPAAGRDRGVPDHDVATEGRTPAAESPAWASAPAGDGRTTASPAPGGHGFSEPVTGDHGRTAEYTGEDEAGADQEPPYYRPLWVEEPARHHRLPDPVRTSAVRAVLIIAVTLIQAMVAFLCTMAGSWLAFPMVLSSVASTVAATWGALDVWVTRQVWNQRNGVVSTPSSTARALRRERRLARRQAAATERAQERIRRRESAGRMAPS